MVSCKNSSFYKFFPSQIKFCGGVLNSYEKGSFNQQINSLTPNEENDPYFLLTESVLWSNKMKKMAASGTMQIINKKEFSLLTTMVPKISEQKKIGELFKKIDSTITLHQRQCEALKKQKRFFLQNMFPKEGESEPRIRFNGFTEPWEQRKVFEIADRYDNLRVPVAL